MTMGKPTVLCAGGCGRLLWHGPTSLPAGQSMCQSCRRARWPGEVRRQPQDRRLQRVCPTCGAKFKGWGRQVYCTPRCNIAKLTKRGYYRLTCKGCGTAYRAQTQKLYCTTECRQRTQAAQRVVKVKAPPAPVSNIRYFNCELCDRTYVVHYGGRRCYCSPACQRDARHRRYARRRAQVYAEDIQLDYIGERDGWRCGLCHKRVSRTKSWPNPRAASLDHIIPLSKGGEHSKANVQLACFGCNWKKNDRGGGEQLRLIG